MKEKINLNTLDQAQPFAHANLYTSFIPGQPGTACLALGNRDIEKLQSGGTSEPTKALLLDSKTRPDGLLCNIDPVFGACMDYNSLRKEFVPVHYFWVGEEFWALEKFNRNDFISEFRNRAEEFTEVSGLVKEEVVTGKSQKFGITHFRKGIVEDAIENILGENAGDMSVVTLGQIRMFNEIIKRLNLKKNVIDPNISGNTHAHHKSFEEFICK